MEPDRLRPAAQGGEVLDEPRRTALLEEAVRTRTTEGWRVESRSPLRMVLVKKRQGNRLLHAMSAVLAVLTLGGFGAPMATSIRERLTVTVDEWGRVHEAAANRSPVAGGEQSA